MDKKFIIISIIIAVTGFSAPAFAQGYPTQPITLVVGMAPGELPILPRAPSPMRPRSSWG